MRTLLVSSLALLVAVGYALGGCSGNSQKTGCGNGVVEDGERCDGKDLGDRTCESFGYDSGTLLCAEDCTFAFSTCTGGDPCGNGFKDPGEECDQDDLGSATCQSQGYSGGELKCDSHCKFFPRDCEGWSLCGDGVVAQGEDCDGTNLAGETCQGLGFESGTLRCHEFCVFDASGCSAELCGNGAVDLGEDCDGDDMGGGSCQSLGYDGGVLTCTAGCTYSEAGCSIACADDAHEPNSTFAEASPVSLDFSETGLVVCQEADADYFAVDLLADTRYRFTVTTDYADGDVDIYLYEPTDQEFPVAAGATTDAVETFVYATPAATAGTHTLEVYRYEALTPTQTYDLDVVGAGASDCFDVLNCQVGEVCLDYLCTPQAAGDTCAIAVDATLLPFSVTGVDMADYQATFELPGVDCTGYETWGKDVFYRLTLTAGQSISADLASTFDAALYLIDDCQATTCLVGVDEVAEGDTEMLGYTATGDEVVYLVVDHYLDSGPTAGTFDLVITSP